MVNQYERSPKARAQCIKIHGVVCKVCGFDFEKMYGRHGKGYIHVHHIVPPSEINEAYEVNPEADLIPVCRNCHAMIHRGDKMLSIEQLKDMLRDD